MNWVSILEKAGSTASTATLVSVPTTAGCRSLVIISQDTRPARPAVPSLSFAIPTATPTANSQDMLSISAPPAFNQEEADDLKGARHVTTLHGGGTERVTDAHQDTADGQTCDGKHQRLTESLQEFHHSFTPPMMN